MAGPLEGLRVLDLTTALSGPVATQILGDLGADVIKIEPPEGDSIRDMGPARHPRMGGMFLHTNRNKRSVVLDLKKETARNAFRRLAARADILVSNVRPKAMARLALSPDDLSQENPSLIYVSIVGYGSGGTHSDKPAYDDLIQAEAGIASLRPPGEPARYTPIALADRVTGILAANAALGALHARNKSGYGQHVEVPMFESISSLVLADHMWGHSFEPPLGPTVYDRYARIRRPFETLDGFISMMVLTDRQWERFFTVVGEPEIIRDPRYARMAERTAHLEELYAVISRILKQRTSDEWVALLEEADIPVARIQTMESLMEHPHLQAVGFFSTEEHPTEGNIISMRVPTTWSRTQPRMSRHAPRFGAHTREVLAEAGLTDDEIEQMIAAGAACGASE